MTIQLIMGGHCYVMLNGLMTVIYSITQFNVLMWGLISHTVYSSFSLHRE